MTWWVGPTSRPADVADRLRALGLQEEEDEFGMILDLGAGAPPEAPLPPGATLDPVADRNQLDGWMEVMAAAFDWPADGGKRRMMSSCSGATWSPSRRRRAGTSWCATATGPRRRPPSTSSAATHSSPTSAPPHGRAGADSGPQPNPRRHPASCRGARSSCRGPGRLGRRAWALPAPRL